MHVGFMTTKLGLILYVEFRIVKYKFQQCAKQYIPDLNSSYLTKVLFMNNFECPASDVTSLAKLFDTDQLDGQWVQLACDTTIFDFSTDGNCTEKLVRFRILDTYNEIYLIARTLCDGE